jgi:hypothetical protein
MIRRVYILVRGCGLHCYVEDLATLPLPEVPPPFDSNLRLDRLDTSLIT